MTINTKDNKLPLKSQTPAILDSLLDLFADQPKTEHAVELIQTIRAITDGRLKKSRIESLRADFPAGVSTIEVLSACLESMRSLVSQGSLTSYGDAWRAFAKRCPVLPTLPEQIEAYLNRYENHRTARDIHTKLAVLYKFANMRMSIPNVIQKVKKPRAKSVEKPSITLDQLRAVLDACQDDTELVLIHLYAGHGLRLSEALRITVADISNGLLFIRGKEREEFLPLLPETGELLLKLAQNKRPDQPLFNMPRRTAGHRITDILHRVGLGKGYSAHTLRHSFSTISQENGMAFTACRRIMRHSKSTETERYTHLSMDHLKGQLEQYSPLRLLNPEVEALHKISYYARRRRLLPGRV